MSLLILDWTQHLIWNQAAINPKAESTIFPIIIDCSSTKLIYTGACWTVAVCEPQSFRYRYDGEPMSSATYHRDARQELRNSYDVIWIKDSNMYQTMVCILDRQFE